jgi:hydrogenase small subunit
MRVTRREFLKVAAGMAGALGLEIKGLIKLQEAIAGSGDPAVIWLQGQSCTGCSVSFLNTISLASVDELLLNHISLEYHPDVMAAAGDFAISAAEVARPSTTELQNLNAGWLGTGQGLKFDLSGDGIVNLIDYALLARRGYILAVEGAIPTGSQGRFCHIPENLTMLDALGVFAKHAGYVVAVGTCAAYGGIPAGTPNPTAALGVSDALVQLGQTKTVVNIPGCPVHPDWLVGTLINVLTEQSLNLDINNRPQQYFGQKIHDWGNCPFRGQEEVKVLGESGCLKDLGCKGPKTFADCFSRRCNSPGPGQPGVNWCIGAGSPCIGCTELSFPDGDFSPFYTLAGAGWHSCRGCKSAHRSIKSGSLV